LRMFERFSDRARKVMALANQEAQRYNHEYIGTEHILLGLVKEGSGVGATVLKNLDVDIKKLRLQIEKLVKSGPATVTAGKLPQTPKAKQVIECAIEESRALNSNYIGTEHILLGLLRTPEGIAAAMLGHLGVKLEDVREQVLAHLAMGEWPAAAEGHERKTLASNCRELPVWQKADGLAQQVYAVTGGFPPEPIPGVASRLRQVALAIPSHIAEAHSRPIPSEARWLLNSAVVSVRELRYLLDFAGRLEVLRVEDHQTLVALAEELDNLLRPFYASLDR
jgi:four helix bundle protein